MLARRSALSLASLFVCVAGIGSASALSALGCSSSSSGGGSPATNGDDGSSPDGSGSSGQDATTGTGDDDASGTVKGDSGSRLDAGAKLDSGTTTADYAPVGTAGLQTYFGAACRFQDLCSPPDAGADAGPTCVVNNVPPRVLTQRADLYASATACLVNLDAGACGDAGGVAQACTDNAFANVAPSPAAVAFCQADGLTSSACMLSSCLTQVGIYGDPAVKKMPACIISDAAVPNPADGGCNAFIACIQAAETPAP